MLNCVNLLELLSSSSKMALRTITIFASCSHHGIELSHGHGRHGLAWSMEFPQRSKSDWVKARSVSQRRPKQRASKRCLLHLSMTTPRPCSEVWVQLSHESSELFGARKLWLVLEFSKAMAMVNIGGMIPVRIQLMIGMRKLGLSNFHQTHRQEKTQLYTFKVVASSDRKSRKPEHYGLPMVSKYHL